MKKLLNLSHEKLFYLGGHGIGINIPTHFSAIYVHSTKNISTGSLRGCATVAPKNIVYT